jgi:predicted nucleic acid-binding protein
MRGGKVFVDTNILVYAYDVSARAKHEVAVTIMRDLWNTGRGITSMQVLQEFFVNATRKIPKPLPVTTAREVVRDFLKWNPLLINGEIIVDAIDIHAMHKYSFWDALIITSAIESGTGTLLSEDLSDRHRIKSIVIKNPFKEPSASVKTGKGDG